MKLTWDGPKSLDADYFWKWRNVILLKVNVKMILTWYSPRSLDADLESESENETHLRWSKISWCSSWEVQPWTAHIASRSTFACLEIIFSILGIFSDIIIILGNYFESEKIHYGTVALGAWLDICLKIISSHWDMRRLFWYYFWHCKNIQQKLFDEAV